LNILINFSPNNYDLTIDEVETICLQMSIY